MTLHTYRLVEQTNWSRVHDAVSMQILGLTRDYERRFGVEVGTNVFAQRFADAKAIADAFERQLVPFDSVLTNLPVAPDAKVRITNERQSK